MSDPMDQEPMDEALDNEMEDSEEDSEEMDEENEGENETKGIEEAAKKPEVYLPGKTLKRDEELVVDRSAYRMLHQAQTGAPCLSFDVIRDDFGNSRDAYPLSMYLLAGTQAARTHVNNLLVMKITNLSGIKSDDESEDESDEELSDSEDEGSHSKLPVMAIASIKHQGCVNRVRCAQVGQTCFAASWSELGRVNLWNLDEQLKAVESPALLSSYNKKVEKSDAGPKPFFTFKGHSVEGYGIDWCPTEPGTLASGDCKGNIHIWRHTDGASWNVDQRPYNSHAPYSVEDLQWSPNEKNVLASCSVDKRSFGTTFSELK
ncbi:glutamate-rich WD repeat-containing protein 1 [Venturia canescens]|uniref:glutamate-rich WD repeat-containing protein 1 n=1 Tax=Venturia canescens TaxID=32260 RepID=UPI001C9CA81E|nr:glutamate-rich WD repeat-containing protein 1 [Venturia canescens]